ncbi:MAG: hypothetical protein JWP89_2754 [Schlesneria sp.]|nr:hypothetical protein [Schlesneria sp.]
MREYFFAWQRKIGCVTLAMACVLTGMWVRSFYYCDVFYVGSTCGSFQLRSTDGGFNLNRLEQQMGLKFQWETSGVRPLTGMFGDFNTVDYDGVTIFLTFLSAYLILIPRTRAA